MEQRFQEDERRLILQIVRDTIATFLKERRQLDPPPFAFLQQPAAAFVSLKLAGELRGCIGVLDASTPLGKTIVHCALGAAFGDPRFPPVNEGEFEQTRVEVSVLSPLRQISNVDEIEVGIHGICLSVGPYRGLLLPQVAVENNWDRQTFLNFTCYKAGLPADAWNHRGACIQIFSAEIFGEELL